MTIKNATRRYNSINTDLRDCDDCTVQPKRTAKELEWARQARLEMMEEAFERAAQDAIDRAHAA